MVGEEDSLPIRISSTFWNIDPTDSAIDERLTPDEAAAVRDRIHQFNDMIQEHERRHRRNAMDNLTDFTVQACGPTRGIAEGIARVIGMALGAKKVGEMVAQIPNISNPDIQQQERQLLRSIYESFQFPPGPPNGAWPKTK